MLAGLNCQDQDEQLIFDSILKSHISSLERSELRTLATINERDELVNKLKNTMYWFVDDRKDEPGMVRSLIKTHLSPNFIVMPHPETASPFDSCEKMAVFKTFLVSRVLSLVSTLRTSKNHFIVAGGITVTVTGQELSFGALKKLLKLAPNTAVSHSVRLNIAICIYDHNTKVELVSKKSIEVDTPKNGVPLVKLCEFIDKKLSDAVWVRAKVWGVYDELIKLMGLEL